MKADTLNEHQKILIKLLRTQRFVQVRGIIKKIYPADIADIFPHLTTSERSKLLTILYENKMAGKTLKELPEDILEKSMENISDDKLAAICMRLSPDDAADLLNDLEHKRRSRVFTLVTGPNKKQLEKLMGYNEETAGGLMTTEFLALHEDLTVKDAITFFRTKERPEEFLYIYIINNENQLVGVLSLRNMIYSSEDKKLGNIMKTDIISSSTDTSQEDIAYLVSQYDLLAIPVVDNNNVLVGVVTVDDVIDVIQEENTEDIYYLANLDIQENIFTTASQSVKLRIPWLVANLATAILAALTVSMFETAISEYVALAVMMPIIAGMGGNAGTQTLTVVVRSLALGELAFNHSLKVLFKEILVGVSNGLIIGIAMSAISYIWYKNTYLALVMFIAMIANLIIAGFFGAMVPLALRKLKLDPALGSSIIVTTATDVGGFFVFLGMASILL